MGVIISIHRKKAFLRDGEWRSADTVLEDQLNHLTSEWVAETGGPKLNAKDPEADTAREIVRRTGGRILMHIPTSARMAAKVYFAKRQYRLFP
jgi:hypothetical protein